MDDSEDIPVFTKTLRLSVALLLGIGSVACGGTDTVSAEEARSYLTAHVKARAEIPSRTNVWYRTLNELLPNVSYAAPNEKPVTVSRLAALGSVFAVEPGVGFKVEGEDGDGLRTAFDDPKAQWKTVHMSFRIERQLASDEPSKTIRVGLAIDGSADFDKIALGLKTLGPTIMFLIRESPVFAYDSSIYSILEDGVFIATVDESNQLALPFIEMDRAKQLLQGVMTLEQLDQLASEPERIIPLKRQGQLLVRS